MQERCGGRTDFGNALLRGIDAEPRDFREALHRLMVLSADFHDVSRAAGPLEQLREIFPCGEPKKRHKSSTSCGSMICGTQY